MRLRLIGGFMVLLAATGCGDTSVAGGGTAHPATTGCTPGQSVTCGCVGLGPFGSQVCERDGFSYGICQCPMPMSDAGSPDVTDASNDVGQRETHVLVTCSGPARETALTNFGNADVRGMSIEVSGRDIELRRLPARFGWSGVGLAAHIRSPRGEAYFNGLAARDRDTTEIAMGPASFGVMDDRQSGNALLEGNTIIRGDTRRLFRFEVGIAPGKTIYHDFVGGYFSLEFALERPRQIFAADDIAFADTHLAVPASAISYSSSCFEAATEHDVQIVPRFADVYVTLDRMIGSTDTIVPVTGLASLGMAAVNEGFEAGVMRRTVVEGLARTNGLFEIPLESVVAGCSLSDTVGHTLGTAVMSGNVLDFRSIRAPIPGLSTVPFVMHCQYAWPTDLARALRATSIEIRFGALSDRFEMTTDGDPGRIQGTLQLEQNSLTTTSDAVSITLHPPTP